MKVLYLAYDILGNYEDANDVAQAVFIKLFDKFHTFAGRSLFSAWLYRITVNVDGSVSADAQKATAAIGSGSSNRRKRNNIGQYGNRAEN